MQGAADSQQLLLVSGEDEFSGEYVARGAAHVGSGQHHRAFVCLVINRDGRGLLQLRRHWLWDRLWDVSAASHPLRLPDHDETYEEAALRAMRDELGIVGANVRKIGGFNYFVQHSDGIGCENEYCAVLIAQYDGDPAPSITAVYEWRWADLDDFRNEVEASPERFTPWARLAVETLIAQGHWPPTR